MNLQTMKINYCEEIEIIEMPKTKFENLFFIDVSIEGQIIPFVFDTGASITVISKSVSKLIGATPSEDTVVGGGNSNMLASLSTSVISTLKIGNTQIENITVVAVDDERLDFGVDENGNNLIVNGFLGWDIIQNFKWTIDGKNKIFTMKKSLNSVNKKKNLDWDNMPIIEAKFNNKPMFFGFDTGNTESMFSQNFIPFLKTKKVKTDIITGVDGVVEEEVSVAENIDITIEDQIISLNDISVLNRDIFPTKKYSVMGLLAADIIQNCKCILDYPGRYFEIIK